MEATWPTRILLLLVAMVLVCALAVSAAEVVVTTKAGRKFSGELVSKSADRITLRIDGKTKIIRQSEIRGEIELVKSTGSKGGGDSGKSGDEGQSTSWRDQRLTKRQINVIRVFEVDLKKKPVVNIPKATIEELLSKYADSELLGRSNRRRFIGAKGYVKLEKIFELAQAHPEVRKLYETIDVHRDPPSMATFRKQVHRRYVINYCGKSGCHSGKPAGKLVLFRERPTSDETVYTNFFILDSHKTNREFDMIDRQKPESSLLIQFGRPRNTVPSPHPEVPGWNPLLRPNQDRRASAIVRWIKMLQRYPPPYEEMIEFKALKTTPTEKSKEDSTKSDNPAPRSPQDRARATNQS